MHLLYNLAIPFLDIYSKEKKKQLSTVHVYANIHSILICNSQKLEVTCPSMSELIKQIVIHPSMNYYSAINFK